MKTQILNLVIIFLPLISGEKDIIETPVKVGKFKFQCTFTLTSDDGAVNLKQSKLACSPKKPKKKKLVNFVLNGHLGNYTVSFSINPNKITKAILDRSDSGAGSVSETCSPGYTNICPPTADSSCPATMSLACPSSTSSTGQAHQAAAPACTCLPTRSVEQDLMDGVSPLGSCYSECSCLPTHLLTGQCTVDTDVMTSLLITGGALGSTRYNAAEVVGNPSCSVPPLSITAAIHLTFVTHDDKILTCGGIRPSKASASCQALDLPTSSWVDHSTMSSTRIWASYVVLPSGTYILGGGLGSSGDDTSEFLPTGSTTWEWGPTLPFISNQACSVAIGPTRFLLIRDTNVQEFDTVLQSWIVWPDLARTRIIHSCAKLGNKVIVAGGVGSGGYLTSTEIIDIQTKQVHESQGLQQARGFFGMATVSWPPGTGEKKVISFGGTMYGLIGSPSTRVDYDTIEVFDDDQEQWVMDTITLEKKNHNFGYAAVPVQLVCP